MIQRPTLILFAFATFGVVPRALKKIEPAGNFWQCGLMRTQAEDT